MVFEWDDFGCSHVISAACQSHDCRDQLLRLKDIHPNFKATLFAIPHELSGELHDWCTRNSDWIELAVHGFTHSSNYECEKMTYEEFDTEMARIEPLMVYYKKIFRAPGWQISTDALRWLADNNWLIADQGYNDDRRPAYSNAYVNYNGQFKYLPRTGSPVDIPAYHGHTWNVGEVGSVPANGIYEDFEHVASLVAACEEFKFLSEVAHG